MGINEFLSNLTVVSVEQAVSLPYCTWRLAVSGAKVIRIESLLGDPNRKVGRKILDEEQMNSYFLSVNSGKKAITLNLKSEKGQKILWNLIENMNVDIFATNQLPGNYQKLGIDYEQLKAVKDDIIWAGVSGFGPERSEAAYDPMIQAYSGIMDTNGEPESGPLKFGVSIADIEAANQAYSEIMKALLHRERTGEGSRIDISMLECCMSLLALHIPMTGLNLPMVKSGNAHPIFSPVGVYKTADGYVSIAVGNDAQWEAIVNCKGFEALNKTEYKTNNQRKTNEEEMNKELQEAMSKMSTEDVLSAFRGAKIPISKVNSVSEILQDSYLSAKLLGITDPKSGLEVTLAPPPVACAHKVSLSFPPRFGQHNEEIFSSLGYDVGELRKDGVI
ncbi:MAG: CoA transferase [Methanomassiliicoccales archaeon]|nr:MAG: CoA transferase [Methanomassiliicoccales archaeon]